MSGVFDAYMSNLDSERRDVISRLIQTVRDHLPAGFTEAIAYGMPSWVVAHDRYPAGYHVTPADPLPFLSLASQKRHVAVYHMGIYADDSLLAWFQDEYPKHMKTRLNMGKSCIRFTNMKTIPFELIGDLVSRMTVDEWVRDMRLRLGADTSPQATGAACSWTAVSCRICRG